MGSTASINLITGKTGEQHVLAIDDAEIYRTLLGNGDFVLVTGAKMNATMNGANKVDIASGTVIMQGRQIKIRSGFVEVDTDGGVIGYKREDAIVIEYAKDNDGIESATLKVIKGANGANYARPSITTGNIDAGETHQMLLWSVRYDGLNFNSLVDHRAILDTTPIQTALDYAESAVANIQSYLSTQAALLEAELDRIRGIAGVAPLTVVSASDLTSAAGVLIVPSSYTYTAGDVFVLYLNGLRVPAGDYSVSNGTNALTVTLDYATSVTYDSVEIEVWRPEES